MRRPDIERAQLGAWMLTCNPVTTSWDLNFTEPIDSWWVPKTYRAEMMEPGDLVLFRIAGTDPEYPPGIWGVGFIIEPMSSVTDTDYLIDIKVELFDTRITVDELKGDPTLAGMEILTTPRNVLGFVTAEQWAALLPLLSERYRPREGPSVTAAVPPTTDPYSTIEVEQAAIACVSQDLVARGWRVEDMQSANVGWDLAAHDDLNGDLRRIEVKGRAVGSPVALLSRHEFDVARDTPAWELALVTESLGDQPVLRYYPAAVVLAHAQPFTYRVDLHEA